MTNARGGEPPPYLIPLSTDGSEVLSFDMASGEGWAAYFSTAVRAIGAYVLLRIGPEDGPPGRPVLFDGEPRLTFPENHAEKAALEVRELRVAVPQASSGFSSSVLREIPFTRIEAAINHPAHRPTLVRKVLPANAVSAGHQPGGHSYVLPPPQVKAAEVDPAIEDPGGYRKPDEFYQDVSDRYLALAALTPRPAQVLAEANGVPVPTVHRWIREAKARGLLLLPSHRQSPSTPERRFVLLGQEDAEAFVAGEISLDEAEGRHISAELRHQKEES